MKNLPKRTPKHLSAIALLLIVSIFYLTSCTGDNKGKPVDDLGLAETKTTSLDKDPAYASLFDMNPPHDVSSTNPSDEELAIFAWREMIALNWQSSYVSSDTLNQRGTPDSTWSYTGTDPFPSQPVVWETYAHRTEFSPSNEQVPQKPFDSPPSYTFGDEKYDGGSGSSAIFNCLDEDSEINSCYLYALDPSDSLMMMYQAKTNRSEYDYVKKFKDKKTLAAAVTRTGNNVANNNYYHKGNPTDNCNCPDSIVCLPCGEINGDEGAIEIKTGWRKKFASETSADIAQFFHRKAIYFSESGEKQEDTFLLVGMHIIHKTVNMPEFIFATWEHESLSKPGNPIYTYISQGVDKTDQKGTVEPVKRLHPVDSLFFEVSANVHTLLAAKNPNSVWLNYNLTGVQAQIVSYADRDSVSSYFLANYAIESDILLQDFYGTFGNPQDPAQTNILKASENKKYNMGGCKGCHGSAQIGGADFSFIIQAGDKDPDVYYSSFADAVEAAKK